MGDVFGYARVSTAAQDPALQLDALNSAGCFRIFTDQVSGTVATRPELTRLVDQLRPGDTVVVWRLDRLGRSVRQLIDFVADLEERQVGFRSLTESIDTTSPGGRMVFHVFAGLAQMERELLSERTQAGLAAARARGRNGGRRSVMTPDKLAVARRMYDARTHTLEAIAHTVGVSRSSVYRALKATASADQPAGVE